MGQLGGEKNDPQGLTSSKHRKCPPGKNSEDSSWGGLERAFVEEDENMGKVAAWILKVLREAILSQWVTPDVVQNNFNAALQILLRDS